MKVNTPTGPLSYTKNFYLLLLIGWLMIHDGICRPLGYHFTGNKKSSQIAFQLVNNLIIVPVKVNNELTLNFILDTGMRTPMLLDEKIAQRLQLHYEREIIFSGLGSKTTVKGYVVNNVDLELPGVAAYGMGMVVLADNHLKVKHLSIQVHGVFGYGLFSRFVVAIDYENRIITLYEPEVFAPDLSFTKVPIDLHDTKPFITASLSLSEEISIVATLLIDTGAGTGLMLDTNSSPLIKAPKRSKKIFIGTGLCGTITGKVSNISSMAISNRQMKDFPAAFTEKNFYPSSGIPLETHGSIGGKILSRFNHVVFDYINGWMFLGENKDGNYSIFTTALITK